LVGSVAVPSLHGCRPLAAVPRGTVTGKARSGVVYTDAGMDAVQRRLMLEDK
jgi:hypothetical protein